MTSHSHFTEPPRCRAAGVRALGLLVLALGLGLGVVAGQTAGVPVPVRIKAGLKKPLVDAEGNTWVADRGFVDGVIADRDVITAVVNTRSPALYRSERYSMTTFSHVVPNGRYMVRLHFAEMYAPIVGPGLRVFSFNVEGHAVKDFDIWARAGGARRAHVEEFRIEVADGKLDITFTRQLQYPVIHGIEILPIEAASAGSKP